MTIEVYLMERDKALFYRIINDGESKAGVTTQLFDQENKLELLIEDLFTTLSKINPSSKIIVRNHVLNFQHLVYGLNLKDAKRVQEQLDQKLGDKYIITYIYDT